MNTILGAKLKLQFAVQTRAGTLYFQVPGVGERGWTQVRMQIIYVKSATRS